MTSHDRGLIRLRPAWFLADRPSVVRSPGLLRRLDEVEHLAARRVWGRFARAVPVAPQSEDRARSSA